jgi:hypothetical protein
MRVSGSSVVRNADRSSATDRVDLGGRPTGDERDHAGEPAAEPQVEVEVKAVGCAGLFLDQYAMEEGGDTRNDCSDRNSISSTPSSPSSTLGIGPKAVAPPPSA